MEELLAEREALKQQIAALREQALSGATPGEKALAQEQLKPLLDDFRTLSVAIAQGQARVTPSPTHELERLDERGDVIRAGQPNQNARVVKMRDPKTGTVTDWPDPSTAAAKPTPSPVDQLERVYDPNNPTRVIKMRDPATNTYVDVPDVAAGSKPQVVNGANGAVYSWDGTKLTPLIAATPKDPQLVQAAGGAIYSFNGKELVELQAGKPQPKETQERPNVKDGYHVTETFLGGDWVVTKYGEKAKPGEPYEGLTRQNTKEGYKVTETFSGGDWTVTNVGERATPRERQTVTTSTEQPFIVERDETGKLVETRNPNYVPKTQGDIAARVGQLQAQANAKKEEVMKKVSGTFTADQALAEFNTWWDSNIQPQTASLQAAAEEANFARGKEVATMRQQALQQAQVAGNQAIQAYQASGLSRVGGGAAEALKKAGEGAGALKDIDWQSAAFVPTDDPGSVANRAKAATDAAYQGLSSGLPTYTPLSPGAELDRTKYTPTFAQQQAAAAAPPPAAAGGVQPGLAPDLFHATPIITNEQGENVWRYPFPGPGGDVPPPPDMTEPMDGTFDYNALAQEQMAAIPYSPMPQPRPLVRRRPAAAATVVDTTTPFAQQALAAGLGAGGLGPTAPAPVPPGFGYDPSAFGRNNLDLPFSPYVYGGRPY